MFLNRRFVKLEEVDRKVSERFIFLDTSRNHNIIKITPLKLFRYTDHAHVYENAN